MDLFLESLFHLFLEHRLGRLLRKFLAANCRKFYLNYVQATVKLRKHLGLGGGVP